MYGGPLTRCPICHHVFRNVVYWKHPMKDPRDSHFEHEHPNYWEWRKRFRYIFLLGVIFPIVVLLGIGLFNGFQRVLDVVPVMILLLSFTVPLALTMQHVRVNREFRREWVATHGE